MKNQRIKSSVGARKLLPRRLSFVLAGVLCSLPLAATAAVPDITELSLEQLLNVTVVGASKYAQKQDEIAAAVSVITRSELKAFGWRTLDEALASLPGIHTSYDRQYSYLGTRGFGLPGDFNTRVLLTLNGNRVNDVVYDAAISGRAFPVDVDLIERIEFIPGPGGAVYGQNALFGVVNIVTRGGAEVNGTELAVAYQDLHAAREGRATWGKVLDNGLDVVLSASVMKARGEDYFLDYPGAMAEYPWLATESGTARGMDGERDKEFLAHLARGAWLFDFSYGDHRKDDPTAQYYSVPLVAGQYQRDRHLLTQLQYQDRFAEDTLEFTARLFLGREYYSGIFYGANDTFTASKPYFATGSSDWQGFEVRLLSTAWSGHKLMLGLEAQDNSRRDQTYEDLEDPVNDLVIPGSGWRLGMYLQDEWALSDSLVATLGLRFDRNDVIGNAVSPRAALIWKATPQTTVKALYGRAHRAPNAFERDYGDGFTQVINPELDGEMIDTLELVADQRIGKDFGVRASLYHWDMQKLVVLGIDSVSGASQYQSGEDVEATGVELSADKTWAWGGRLRGSVSWQDVAYANGNGLDNSPRVLGKLNFSGPLWASGLRLGAEAQYTSARQAIDGTELDGYWLANLNLSSDRLMKGLEASLQVYNLFDADYAHPGSDINWQTALEQDGRSARLKLVWRF